MADERMPWDQQEGEPSRWYQRFNAYRLADPGRSILALVNAEKERKGSKKLAQSLPGAWRDAAEKWQWKIRAQAWDKYLSDQAQDEIETAWREKIMGPVEVLGRMSEHGRNDMGQYFKIVERWTETPLPSEEILKEEEFFKSFLGNPVKCIRYLVRKVVLDMDSFLDPERSRRIKKFSDSPKNGLSIELYDAHGAQSDLGKYHKLFVNTESEMTSAVEAGTFNLPADVIAPQFLAAYRDIRDHRHTEYIFYGGRGSTKSSFTSLVIIYLLVNNSQMHALALRQVADTLRDSVYSQITWAISELGLADKFKMTISPMEITYLPTGQKIYFRGADNPEKIKSIKPPFGSISILWFEETSEFHGEEAIRNITQSAIRGTDLAYIFKTYNPPRTSGNWINKYVLVPKDTQYQHRSDYRTVPVEWLGQVFIDEAEHLKEVNPDAYNHEYLGEVNGLGDQVFTNVQLRKITDEEISQFDHITWGGDWGFYPDPADFGPVHYDAARRALYIFGEYRAWKKNNKELFEELVRNHGITSDDLLILDSAEPKSVADFRQYSIDGIPMLDDEGNPKVDAAGKPIMLYGPTCRGAEKGSESVKYSIKWLQGLTAIVIDPERCPYAAIEFVDYAYERTKDGEIIEAYPDKNNHSIDRVRYATNLIWKRRGQ